MCIKMARVINAYSSTLEMKAVRSSETSVNFYPTARHYITEDSTLLSVHFKSI
jgi:hypothetical protein